MPSNELFQPQNNGDTSVAKSGTMPKTSLGGHENLDMFSFGTQYGQILNTFGRPQGGGQIIFFSYVPWLKKHKAV